MKLILVRAALAAILIGFGSAWAGEAASPGAPRAESSAVSAGVPLSLARERAAAVADVRYRLAVDLRPDRMIVCTEHLSFDLAEVGGALVLDFAGREAGPVLSGEDTVAFRFENGHVVIPRESLRRGENAFTIRCRSSTAPLHWEENHLYSLFVPARAREVFPCFDQPDMKARFSLSIVVPDGWTAVSNAPVEEIPSPAQGGSRAGGREIIFARTEPLATYHFAFAAGAFRKEEAQRGGRAMTLYHLETDSAKVARNLDAIFDLHAEAIRWMEEYTGIPYPFGKFDFVVLPVFPYSGMEHPGAIFYRAERLFLDESATEMDRLRRASVISHETAHMWFGDLVTMTWFDDVWLKEAFAQFMADRIIRPAFPGVDHRLLFAASHYDALYAVERTNGTHPIRQRLDNLDEAGSLYGNIIYHKPPVMLNQLETLVGAEALRDGLRGYLRTYQFANASWEDLVAILDQLTDRDLEAWSDAWVMERGRPTISIARIVDERGACRRLRVAQEDPLGRDLVWPQRFSLCITDCSGPAAEAGCRLLACELDGAAATLSLDVPITGDDCILPCAGGAGFGYFALDAESVRLLRSNPPHFAEPLHRGIYALVLRDNVLEGNLGDVALYLRIVISELRRETVEVNLEALLDYLVEAFWCFLPERRRQERAGEIEGLLLETMTASPEASTKSACFKAFRSVAVTEDGVQFLRDMWEKRREVEGLRLSDRDYAAVACELAVRGVTGWRDILDGQEARFADEELRRRFQFVRRAASAERAERAAFFAGLSDIEGRRREPWVLEALSYLHHPLRSSESERFILPSLELLEEIRATGDIFFPRDWIETTLRYHSSDAAVSTVREFLGARPGYSERLRLIIWQAADRAIRANRIRRGTE